MSYPSLPPTAGTEREEAILGLVKAGTYEITWEKITAQHEAHRGEFWVLAQPLRIGGLVVNVSARTNQLIADYLGALLMTPKLADLMWAQRVVTLPPMPRGQKNMASTSEMIAHSEALDKALAAQGNPGGIVGTMGKLWVIDNALLKLKFAMNYGWHFVGKSFQGIKGEEAASRMVAPDGSIQRLIQGRGTRHDMEHTDYSQVCYVVAQDCTVDGQPMLLSEVLLDPELAPLASHQGVVTCLRQPGVPVLDA